MKIKNKYFHGVRCYNNYLDESDVSVRKNNTLNDILHKYECIFKCGHILPYNRIKELYGDIDRHPHARNNGEDRISISLHKRNPEQRDIELLRKNERYFYFEENAFSRFICSGLYSSSIVLNESIKNRYELIPKGMYLEREVPEPISLKYMEAISILPNEKLIPFFENEEDIEKYGCLLNDDFNLDFIHKLNSLLEKYGYDVPIINIVTGHELKKVKKIK